MPAMFHPRHYRFLAQSLRRAYDKQNYRTDRLVVEEVMESLISDLAAENPFFSETRFREIFDEAASDKET